MTADSTVTNLYNAGTILDEEGNTVTIVGADGTEYVSGNSEYTVTVTGEYSEETDLSGASEIDGWENHEIERPEELA